MSRETKTFIVDSFTDQAFKGNPAGVCLSNQILDSNKMQVIAAELNLSETAFVVIDFNNKSDSDERYSIRYFSPKMEIPLCGHATLATAKVLFEETGVTHLRFLTSAQLELSVRKVNDLIEMEFPIYELQPTQAPDVLLAALGVGDFEYSGYNAETKILMLEISCARDLAELRPDFNALLASHDSINGVLVTARADDDFDFHSRYFWPWSGTNEDPVTGGTHTFLAKYWGRKLGKSRMQSFQSSERTGRMEVELIAGEKVLIRGNAVVVFAGALKV